MTHVREQMRDAAKTALTGLTTTGDRVHKGDPGSRSPEQLPALFINSRDEAGEPLDIQGTLERALDLVITGVCSNADDVEATLNLIASEVETAWNHKLGGLAKGSFLVATEFTKLNESTADASFGAINLVFRILYFTQQNQPDVAV